MHVKQRHEAATMFSEWVVSSAAGCYVTESHATAGRPASFIISSWGPEHPPHSISHSCERGKVIRHIGHRTT